MIQAVREIAAGRKDDQDKPDPRTLLRLFDSEDFSLRVRQAFAVSTTEDNPLGWRSILDDLPVSAATWGLHLAMRHGEAKYGHANWKKISIERYKAAALRHLLHEQYYPEDNGVDQDSGLDHLAHCAASIAFVLELWP